MDNDFGGDPDGLLSPYYLSDLPKIVIELVTTTACDAELTRVCDSRVSTCRDARRLLRNVLRIPRQIYSQLVVPVEAVTTTFAAMNQESSFVAERLQDVPPLVTIDQTFGAGDCGLPTPLRRGSTERYSAMRCRVGPMSP